MQMLMISVLRRFAQTVDNAAGAQQIAKHQGGDERGSLGGDQRDDDGDRDGEDDEGELGNRLFRIGHAHHAFLLGGEQLHQRHLDDRHHAHVGIRRHRDGSDELGRQLGRDEDRRRTVNGADGTDGSAHVDILQQQGGEDQRAIDPELTSRAEHDHPRHGKQRAEIDHRAHADEDQQREDLGFDPGFVEIVKEAALGVSRHAQVGEDAAKADRDEQDGLKFLGDRQVDEHSADHDHDQVLAPQGSRLDDLLPQCIEIHAATLISSCIRSVTVRAAHARRF